MQNILPNDGAGAKFASWTPTVSGAATAPVGTYNATAGSDSQPAVTLSATGTSGGVLEQSAAIGVESETAFIMSVVVTASSAAPTIVPFTAVYKDSAGNVVATHTPIASAAAVAAAVQYAAVTVVPDGAVTVTFKFAWISWASTGGYSAVVQSPVVASM